MRHRKYLFLVSLIIAFACIGEVNAITATGGTISYAGGYTIHTFTSNGTFTVASPGNVEYLVVAGAGGGGSTWGGGGGAGGLLQSASQAVSVRSYAIVVGSGGAGGQVKAGANGSNSSITGDITVVAVGGGGGDYGQGAVNGRDGGSGGGGGPAKRGGIGIAGPPRQGYNGGNGSSMAAGGGGGAGAAGGTATGSEAGQNSTGIGGVGIASSISGSSVYYAGGGGGGVHAAAPASGGNGGGGTGGSADATLSTAGIANTGGGGGGGGGWAADSYGADGGSGIVIIRYLTESTPSLQLSLVSPTPANNQMINPSSAIVNLSSNMNLSSCTLNVSLASQSFGILGDGSDGSLNVAGANTIVNNYTYLAGNEPAGDSVLIVSSASEFSAGDEILVIQMQDYSLGAGQYEFKRISSISGNNLTLSSNLGDSYYSGTFNTASSRAAQVVRVPQYTTVAVQGGASIVPAAWNGYTGGIVAFRASGGITVIGSIDATGKGFRGGPGGGTSNSYGINGYQGESYPGLGLQAVTPNAGGGSGGLMCNECVGGSGASHGTSGDTGKRDGDAPCGSATNPGSTYGSANLSSIYLGSGGGGGSLYYYTTGILAPGGNGGGIILVFANSINISGSIASKGTIGSDSTHGYSSNGGSGSGGSVYLSASSIINANFVDATGGPAQTATVNNGDGGYGGAGRIRLDYNNVTGTTSPSHYNGSYGTAPSKYSYNMPVTNADSSTSASYTFLNLSNATYSYYASCTSILGAFNSTENRTFIANVTNMADATPPQVAMVSPSSGTQTPIQAQTFSCNATDSVGLSNITLKIWNSSNSLIYSNTSAISGTNNSTSWDYTFASRGNFTWNCLAYDNSSNSAYAASNATLTIQKYARLDVVYPSNGAGISRGKTDAEDVIGLVPDNMAITARVADNETGQGISGVQCGLSIDGAYKWDATSNASGYCVFSYDKSMDSFGTHQLSINQSNLPSDYTALSVWSNTTFKLENWSLNIDVGNYRTGNGTFYYAGDLVLVSLNLNKDGAPADATGLWLAMTNQVDQALSQVGTSAFTRISTGFYQIELLVPSGTSWVRWKAVALSNFSGQDSNATSGLHSDMGARPAPVAQLNFTMTNSSGQPLSNSKVTVYRKGVLGRYAVLNQTMSSGTQSLQQPLIQNDSNYDLEISTPDNYGVLISNFNLSAGLNFATQQANFTDAMPNQTRLMSPVLASNATGFSTSTLTFVKTFEPTSICSCQNWSFASSSCLDAWVCNSTSAYSYASNSTHFWFNVTHFTGYALGQSENENLTIWDETDSGMPYGNQMKYISQNIRFFANYSNSSSEPITGATCQIWFTDSGWNSMAWNNTNLYEYTRSFNSGGSFDWNVSCNKTGQTTLTTNDTVLVNSTIAVVLNSPADNAIVKSAVITYNWTPYGFPGDPSCNITRNGSLIHISSCTNNEPCTFANTTANGYYIWNVTCNSGATTRESSTRALTVNTLYHSTNVEGILNMNITEITSISLPQNTISFGTVEITQTYDSYPGQFFVIKNDGNTIVDIEVNATNPFLSTNCSSLPCSAYQVKVGANSTTPYPICSGNPSKETYANMYGSSSGLLINDFNFVDNDDSANVYIKFRLPNDEPPGSKPSTVTFWAKSASSYACD